MLSGFLLGGNEENPGYGTWVGYSHLPDCQSIGNNGIVSDWVTSNPGSRFIMSQ